MRHSHFRLILLTFFGAAQLCSGGGIQNNRKGRLKLGDILPVNQTSYDKLVPPLNVRRYANGSKAYDPAVVSQTFFIMSIDSFNTLSMSFTVDLFLKQMWIDHRLRYPNDIRVHRTVLDTRWLKDIWQPDTFYRNAKSMKNHTLPVTSHFCFMYNNKTLRYEKRATLELSCPMNFALYPHDTHRCRIQVESMAYFEYDLIYRFARMDLVNQITIPQMVLVNITPADCTRSYTSGRYSCVEIVFLLQRDMGYYLINTYIPTCAIVTVSWITFWIRPEALPSRVTLGVTSLLTLLTQHSKSQESLPQVSYLKVVDIFMLISIIFVFLSLVEMSAVIMLVHGVESTTKKNVARRKRWRRSRKIAISSNSFEINANNNSSRRFSFATSFNANVRNRKAVLQRRHYALQLDRVCRFLFPSLFLLLNSLYWSWALSLRKP